jgi:hypothetical protein
VWNAPPVLKHVTRLITRYGDCQTLFFYCLGIQSASIKHVADELCSFQEGRNEDIAQRCEELLLILERYLSQETEFTAHHFLRIRHARVFPVSEAGKEPQAVVLRALQDDDWYIPDKMTLEMDFRNKVNLLAFSVRSIEKLKFLWTKLNCQRLFLSHAVDVAIEPRGDKRRDLSREAELQTRVTYITWYVFYLYSANFLSHILQLEYVSHYWTSSSATSPRVGHRLHREGQPSTFDQG